ncbi:hypothetical protein D1001_05315 [Riemerella anatipestifer]|uniref:hypothetical protein n=1 Tax=Riemerella anatipestifer TaxID=34085 RepID=UPI00129D8880|nr:hypothetical protein [Riemerella anatipestifer]MRN02718.1 hypothetical protein [Riemerella anatipestifer]
MNAQKEGYKAIIKELPERMTTVLKQIEQLGECTYTELANAYNINTNLVTNRISDLQKVGLIRKIGTKECNGRQQTIFKVCSLDEAKKIQKQLYIEYRSKREDLETDFITLANKTETTKDLIRGKIEYYKTKIDLLMRFAV